MKRILTLSLVLGLLSGGSVSPVPAWGKQKNTASSYKADSTYEYVSRVFSKLQSHWEPAAYEQMVSNTLLTFVLNEDGTIASTKLQGTENDHGTGERALSYIRQQAPFGRFPDTLQGSQLEFKFKIAPESLQMVSYQVVPPQKREAVVKYNEPINGAAMGASLFYMSAQAPITGRVSWTSPELQTDSEQSMLQYVDQIQSRIQQNWRLPEGVTSSERAVALLMIDRDGSLLSATLKQSSGNKLVDKAALQAIFGSAPFARVPVDAPSLPVEIEYVFERVAPEPSDTDNL